MHEIHSNALQRKLRAQLVIRSIRNLCKEQGVLSLTVVGSFHDNPLFEDVDVVIIFDKLTISGYLNFLERMEQVRRRYSDDLISVFYEDRIAPILPGMVKPLNLLLRTIIIHRLLFDRQLYVEYCKLNRLTPSSWQRYSPIVGIALSNVYRIGQLSKADILQSRSGIEHYIGIPFYTKL